MTTLLPVYRESTAEAVERMVEAALARVVEREPEVTYVGTPGEVFFYRITPKTSYVLLAQLVENGDYEDLWGEYKTPWDEECLTEAYEEAFS